MSNVSYAYTSNKLSSISGENLNVTFQYRCNGLSSDQWGIIGCESDRVSQTVNPLSGAGGVTTNYVLDIASSLTQVLQDGINTYVYGPSTDSGQAVRIAQMELSTEYFLGNALGSVRQMTDETGALTYARSYDPYGVVVQTAGVSQSVYGYTNEYTSHGLIYLRSRWYDPASGRFPTRDSWQGDYNRPLSLNRWNYGYGNPVKYTDPSGHTPEHVLQELIRTIPQNTLSIGGINILAFISNDCSISSSLLTSSDGFQYDLTEYLALAMTKHGQDPRVKQISNLITWALPSSLVIAPAGSVMLTTAYLKFYNLEATGKEWDIKQKIDDKLGKAIVLCGHGIHSCDWFDYSTPGNIHFGYVAGLAKINYFISGVLGGVLEQKDLRKLEGKFDFGYCGWTSGIPLFCDNPHDQYAVDFGFMLAKKYPNGVSTGQLKNEFARAFHGGLFNVLQKPPIGRIPKNRQALPEINRYDADYFNN